MANVAGFHVRCVPPPLAGADARLPRRVGAGALTLAVSLIFAPTALAAQSVVGRVVEEGASSPVLGAFVRLLDNADRPVAGVLTDSAGRFLLRAPNAGRYRVRSELIGRETVTSEPLELTTNATRELVLRAPLAPVALEAVEVAGERRCGLRADLGQATARAWEEARKALRVQVWTRGRPSPATIRTYLREIEPRTLLV